MKLVIIIGPHAVGKMTVGQQLAKVTKLKLFHNHMTIDIVHDLFFDIPDEKNRLVKLFRDEIFNAYSNTDEYGIIFTFMWAFDSEDDWDYIANLEKLFISKGAEVFYVELEADYDIRIDRNKTENRLLNKPTKRDLDFSEKLFIYLEDRYRLNSLSGEIEKENYLRINNTDIAPEVVAGIIKDRFQL
jgi:hypothetical protein